MMLEVAEASETDTQCSGGLRIFFSRLTAVYDMTKTVQLTSSHMTHIMSYLNLTADLSAREKATLIPLKTHACVSVHRLAQTMS